MQTEDDRLTEDTGFVARVSTLQKLGLLQIVVLIIGVASVAIALIPFS